MPTVDLTAVDERKTLSRGSVDRKCTVPSVFSKLGPEIWTEDGVLLAQSRELAVLLPMA